MSSMALFGAREYRDFDLRRVPVAPGGAPASARQNVFRRILAAVARSRWNRVEEEAGRFIANHGGRLTDDIERQLTAHFNGGSFRSYAARPPFRPFVDL